jgi:hypothetical protein
VDDLLVRLDYGGVVGQTNLGCCYLIYYIFAQFLDRFRTCWFVLDLHYLDLIVYGSRW